jgi:GNAT superfamily N-acetyltransferase
MGHKITVMGKLAVTVRPATAADVTPLAEVLARAFHDDPLLSWMLPREHVRRARAQGMFSTVIRAEALRHGAVEVACAGDKIVGGTVWLPPGHWQPTAAQQLRSLPGYTRALGRRFGRGMALVLATARIHPREPHWYLSAIGVDPGRQGHGVGSILLRSRLRRCDEAGQPAYLESSKAANVPLYRHFGFQPTGTPAMPAGAPVVTAMWRPPATTPPT